jgi:4-amino-4-deoxy-L-arabinose transferase-like glycosyltransferase
VPSRVDVRARRLTAVAIAGLAFAFAYLVQDAGDAARAHYALVRALADGRPNIDESLEHPALRTIDITRFEGAAYAAKPPGLAGASVPPYVVLEAAGVETTGDPDRVVWGLHLWSVVVPAVALLLLVRRVADRIEPRYGVIAAVTLGMATLVLPFSTLFFNHILSAALGFLAFVLLLRERETAPRPRLVAAAGLAAGLAVVVEYPVALVAVVLGVFVAAGAPRLRRLGAYAVGVAVGVAPLLAFNAWAFGSPFRLSYEDWHYPGAEPLPGLFGLASPTLDVLLRILFDSGGIAPVLAPAIVGGVVLWRRGDRWLAGIPLVIVGLFVLYNAANTNPFGGASPGPRYLIPALPFVAVLLAAAWRTIPGATAGLAAGAALFMTAATLTSPLGAGDQQVVHRLMTGGYVDSVASFLSRHGGFWDAPFLGALAVAALAALLVTPTPQRWSREAAAALVAGAGWAILMSQTPRLLRHGDGGELAVIAIACATAVATVGVYRARLPVVRSPLRSHPTGTER